MSGTQTLFTTDVCQISTPINDDHLAVIGISAHNPSFGDTELSEVVTALLKSGLKNIIFLETGELYRHTLIAQSKIKNALQGVKNTDLSQKELEDIEYNSRRRTTQIISKCLQATFLTLSQTKKVGTFEFFRTSASSSKKFFSQQNLTAKVEELKKLLKKDGRESEANKIKANGEGTFAFPSNLHTDINSAISNCALEIKQEQQAMFDSKVAVIPKGRIIEYFSNSIDKRTIIFCQWNDLWNELVKNPQYNTIKNSIERLLEEDPHASPAFTQLIDSYVPKLVTNQLAKMKVEKNISPPSQEFLEKLTREDEENFVKEELMALHMMKKLVCDQNKALFVFCYPFSANRTGEKIFELLSFLSGNSNLKYLDISRPMYSTELDQFFQELAAIPATVTRIINEYSGFCRTPLSSPTFFPSVKFTPLLPPSAFSQLLPVRKK